MSHSGSLPAASAGDASAPARRVALVTGSSRGLGLAIARQLARDGHVIVLTGTRLASACEAAECLAREGIGDVLPAELDVASQSSVRHLFGQIDDHYGRLDVLVNNAGIAPRVDGRKSRVEDTSLADWQRTLDINLTGAFLACRAAVPLMRRNRFGRIIQITSRAGRTRSRLASAHYAATKAGLIGFSRILADEVGADGITVNCVAPTRIATPMAQTVADAAATDREFVAETPVGRIGTTADVCVVVSFLASAAASFTTGAIIDVTGGQFMP